MPGVSFKQCGGVLERDLTFEAESQRVAATDGWRGVTWGVYPSDGERRSGSCCKGLMDPACVCAGGGMERRGDGFLHGGCSGAALGGGLAQEDHCGMGEIGREGGW